MWDHLEMLLRGSPSIRQFDRICGAFRTIPDENLPEALTLANDALSSWPDALRAGSPSMAVSFVNGHVPPRTLPLWRWLHGRRLHSGAPHDRLVRAFAGLEGFLAGVDLPGGDLSNDAVAALVSAHPVHTLLVPHNPLDDQALACLSGLRRVDLRGTGVTLEGLVALAGSVESIDGSALGVAPTIRAGLERAHPGLRLWPEPVVRQLTGERGFAEHVLSLSWDTRTSGTYRHTIREDDGRRRPTQTGRFRMANAELSLTDDKDRTTVAQLSRSGNLWSCTFDDGTLRQLW